MIEQIEGGMNSEEMKAAEKDRVIVRFKNIDNEKFTHSYKGISISVNAGQEYTGRLPECDHLATHLARKILARDAKSRVGSGKDALLWTSATINELKKKILIPLQEMASVTPISPEEARRRDLERIEEDIKPQTSSVPEQPEAPLSPAPEVTKQDVIKDLKKRGAIVDETKSKAELLEELMELEAKGVIAVE